MLLHGTSSQRQEAILFGDTPKPKHRNSGEEENMRGELVSREPWEIDPFNASRGDNAMLRKNVKRSGRSSIRL